MTDAEFRELVRAMRSAQRAYFRSRLPSDLSRSKELERAVDEALKPAPEQLTVQKTFWGDANG